jgi:ABC-type uncharacterized transport system permease subunit
MTGWLDPRRILLAAAAPLLALLFALTVSGLALRLNGNEPVGLFREMLDYGTTGPSLVSTVNRAVPYFLSGLAVAIGFRMALFNIGVEGQYRLAALIAAWLGAQVSLPAPLHVLFILLVAMTVGAGWAGVAGALRVTRGVSEVISTIMLNAIAVGVSAYLLADYLRDDAAGGNVLRTEELADSARIPDLNPALEAVGVDPPPGPGVYGFTVLAVVVGVVFHVVIQRTRFGFDLRATGLNPFAARASGVDADRMVLSAMLLSGAVAGLVGMPFLLGDSGSYGLDFPTGVGFTGIAVALLGRNRPVGIALGALLFGFLERSSQVLQRFEVPQEISVLMQGSILLSVVIAYEVVRRVSLRQAERAIRMTAAPVEPAGTGAAR